jgi:hypothetical protein
VKGTVTKSTPNLTTTPASLLFTPANFNIDQAVLVSTEAGAVPGAQSVLLKAGPLGQFKLPVTITPTSNTIFFIDPRNDGIGNDNFPGTAARPWRSVAKALTGTATTGSRVATVASAGNDVVVTILAGGTETGIASNISTPNLPAGSVTVLKAPSAGTFTLSMGSNTLTLNKGYKLQDIKITFSLTSSGEAVKITDPTAGLASVEVDCTGSSAGVTCVKVTGSGSHTLKDVKVKVNTTNANNTAIKNEANTNLTIVGGVVELTGDNAAITLINAQGVLIAKGLTVDMTGSGHQKDSRGIVLNKAGSSVTGSTIKVNRGANDSHPNIAIGIKVQASGCAVEDSTFIGLNTVPANAIGVDGITNLFSFRNNTFSGLFTQEVR